MAFFGGYDYTIGDFKAVDRQKYVVFSRSPVIVFYGPRACT